MTCSNVTLQGYEHPVSMHVGLVVLLCRHPASGYVQGMNDVVTPFVAVFLSEVLPGHISTWAAESLTEVGAHLEDMCCAAGCK